MTSRSRTPRKAAGAKSVKKKKAPPKKAAGLKKLRGKMPAAKKAAPKKAAPKKAAPKKAAPKKAAPKKKAASKAKKKGAKRKRMKIVWAVRTPTGKTLKVFSYPERERAYAEAAKISAKKGTTHLVHSARVAMTEDE